MLKRILDLAPFSPQGKINFFSKLGVCKIFSQKNFFCFNYFVFPYNYAII
jgi:hypothetical protein